jgi:hypothetical protein
VAPEDTLKERVAEHGLKTFKTGLHFDSMTRVRRQWTQGRVQCPVSRTGL